MNKIKQEMIFIPGAERSGTSSVHELLTQQDAVSETRVKEPDFFLTPTEEIKNNTSEYLRNFKEEDKISLDSSVSYALNKTVPSKIKFFLKKEPKIIILLRDPVRRAYTSHYHNHYEARVDNRLFLELIQRMKEGTGSVEEREKKIKQHSIRDGEINVQRALNRGLNWLNQQEHTPFHNLIKYPDYSNKFLYFTSSNYTNWVKRYQKRFSNVKIIFFEELVNETDSVLEDLFNFLNIEYNKNLKLPHENETRTPNKITNLFKRLKPSLWLVKMLKKVVPNCLIYKPKKSISEEEYNKARELMSKEYTYWFEKHPWLRKYWHY